MADIKWEGDQFLDQLQKRIAGNLEKAAIHLVNQIKVKLNRSQPYKISRGKKGVWYKGEDPSTPGTPPKKVRGDLQRSISYEMDGKKLTVKVGSNSPYSRPLELGTQDIEPRPFLRSTLDEEKDKVSQIIGTE